ncbi:hypothetical protein F5887DRAFT_913114 [Amanita rubescens]|nr:hypothetical protein F5887DRAFT_913114 [Amanita rubescens]
MCIMPILPNVKKNYTCEDRFQHNLMLMVPPRHSMGRSHILASTCVTHDVKQTYAIRFFRGMAESSTHYMLGSQRAVKNGNTIPSWYRTEELGRHSVLFMFRLGRHALKYFWGPSGRHLRAIEWCTLHAGAVAGDGSDRLRFVIDGVITLPITLYGFLVFPDLQATTNAFYKRVTASTRLEGKVGVRVHIIPPTCHGQRLARRALSRWRWYGCRLLSRFALAGLETESVMIILWNAVYDPWLMLLQTIIHLEWQWQSKWRSMACLGVHGSRLHDGFDIHFAWDSPTGLAYYGRIRYVQDNPQERAIVHLHL